MDIQTLIVAVIVLAAALFVGNRFRRTFLSARATTGKGGKNCGPDCGCSPR
ncbi:MAG TPA: FeoB-associated Cys-rich membrane protein [Longimicrobium sp.]|nr:FeoB-associated Cys-rich membrane protein [Longimicrobium sp.]